MFSYFDLHTHSLWSDGDYAPGVVAEKAKKKGIKGVVLTDHDTLLGRDEFADACSNFGLESVQGIEISTTLYKTDIHILGYGKDFNVEALNPLLEKARRNAFQRMKRMADKLREKGLADIDIKELQARKGERALLAKYDVVKAIVSQYGMLKSKAWDLVKKRGAPAYVPYDRERVPSPKQAIEYLRSAKAIAVLAHPGQITERTDHKKETAQLMRRIIKQVISDGIDGIEAYSPHHTKEQEQEFCNIAKKHDLLITGGSDFHGDADTSSRPLSGSGINQTLWQKFLSPLH